MAQFGAPNFLSAIVGGYEQGSQQAERSRLRDLAEQGRILQGKALTGDQNALAQLGQVDPQAYMQTQQFTAQQKAQRLDELAAGAYAANTPEKWAAFVQQAAAQGHTLGPGETRDSILAQAMTLKDQLAQANSDRSFNQQKTNADRSYALDERQFNETRRAHDLEAWPKYGVIGEDQFGAKVYGYPPAPGAAPQVGAQPVAPPGAQSNVMDTHGDEFISQLDPKIGNQVRAIIEGRAPYPTGMLLKTPYGQKLASYVTQADPTFESANATARAKIQADYSTGMIAKTNNALNTAIKHMRQMSDAADALGNYDKGGGLGPFTNTANAIKNTYLTESGDPRVTNFKSISGKVAEELTRAYRGAGGAEADISRELEILRDSNSPSQLHSAIGKMAELLRSKIEANEAQYQSVMGPLVKPRPMISKEAQEALDVISGRANGDSSQQGAGAIPPAAIQELSANPTPEMQQHFDAVFGQGAARRALGQ